MRNPAVEALQFKAHHLKGCRVYQEWVYIGIIGYIRGYIGYIHIYMGSYRDYRVYIGLYRVYIALLKGFNGWSADIVAKKWRTFAQCKRT